MSIPESNSPILIDNYNRRMDYLRLAITDRCNLRCRYCMPAEGVKYVSKENILSWEEMYRICRILVNYGLRKIRITGGEPFVRKGLLPFLGHLTELDPKPVIGITTNGVLLGRYLEDLKATGISRLNISLDSLSPTTFHAITRRDNFKETWRSIIDAVYAGFDIKINMVIQPGINDHEIVDFARLTQSLPITVRYIEPMPFSGTDGDSFQTYPGTKIKDELEQVLGLQSLENNTDTVATQYHIPGAEGTIGIIYAYSRTFCASCSRMRVSAQGQMRTCLYGQNVLDLRELLRCGSSDKIIIQAIHDILQHRFKDGFEAEQHRINSHFESMSSIGG